MRRALFVLPVIAAMLLAVLFAARPFAQAGDQSDTPEDHRAPELRPIPEDIQSKLGPLQTTRTAEELAMMRQQSGDDQVTHLVPESRSDEDFLAVLRAEPSSIGKSNVVSVQRGSDVSVPIAIIFEPQLGAPESITVKAVAVDGEYMPASYVNNTTPEEMMRERMRTGKVSGALDLGSTVSFSPAEVELKPNESNEIIVKITIPSDWPTEVIGDKIPYQIFFKASNLEAKDVRAASSSFSVKLVG